MNSFIVRGQERRAPTELQVLNFRDAGSVRFVNQKRTGVVNEVIVHETVTTSARSTVSVLEQRKLGVHFIMDAGGIIYQHGDLAEDLLWHASEHNPRSVGIEVVNPYYPKFLPKGVGSSPWSRILDAPWADGGKYVVPTPAQAETTTQLLMWLTSEESGLAIPPKFVGVTDHKIAMAKLPQSQVGPGIYAHHYFGHMDGAWLVLYSWLRMQPALPEEDAYEEACRLATGARKGVDLEHFYAENPYLES